MSAIFFFLAITVLDSEIQKQILSNYQDLLSQTVWVEKLEEILAIMQNHVQVNKNSYTFE